MTWRFGPRPVCFWHGVQMTDEGVGSAAIIGAIVLAAAAVYGFIDAQKKIGRDQDRS